MVKVGKGSTAMRVFRQLPDSCVAKDQVDEGLKTKPDDFDATTAEALYSDQDCDDGFLNDECNKCPEGMTAQPTGVTADGGSSCVCTEADPGDATEVTPRKRPTSWWRTAKKPQVPECTDGGRRTDEGEVSQSNCTGRNQTSCIQAYVSARNSGDGKPHHCEFSDQTCTNGPECMEPLPPTGTPVGSPATAAPNCTDGNRTADEGWWSSKTCAGSGWGRSKASCIKTYVDAKNSGDQTPHHCQFIEADGRGRCENGPECTLSE